MRTVFPVAVAVAVASSSSLLGCHRSPDDSAVRSKWLHEQASAHHWYVREALNGTPDIHYYDGWYAPEADPKTGGAWRWMDRRGIVRLRTRVAGHAEATDMTVTLNGWVPWESVGLRTNTLEVSVNGHVLETFDPPHETFAHTVFVPRFLLEKSDWVDLVITAANTARPRGDWRDLGFCTTGLIWKPAS